MPWYVRPNNPIDPIGNSPAMYFMWVTSSRSGRLKAAADDDELVFIYGRYSYIVRYTYVTYVYVI